MTKDTVFEKRILPGETSLNFFSVVLTCHHRWFYDQRGTPPFNVRGIQIKSII